MKISTKGEPEQKYVGDFYWLQKIQQNLIILQTKLNYTR